MALPWILDGGRRKNQLFRSELMPGGRERETGLAYSAPWMC